MAEYTITLPWPDAKLSSNARVHWSQKARLKSQARTAAWALAREQGVKEAMPDASLTFTYHPPDNRRRDVQNVPSMLKAYIDGIADAMGCDDHGFRVHYPAEFAENRPGGAIICAIKSNTVVLKVRGQIS